MSVIIRLQNLPWNANALDIRRFFQGLSIPDGGVHIIGGEKGDAFIAFSMDEDARQAMMKDAGSINGYPVRLLLSSKTEMQNVIAAAKGGPPPPLPAASSLGIPKPVGFYDRPVIPPVGAAPVQFMGGVGDVTGSGQGLRSSTGLGSLPVPYGYPGNSGQVMPPTQPAVSMLRMSEPRSMPTVPAMPPAARSVFDNRPPERPQVPVNIQQPPVVDPMIPGLHPAVPALPPAAAWTSSQPPLSYDRPPPPELGRPADIPGNQGVGFSVFNPNSGGEPVRHLDVNYPRNGHAFGALEGGRNLVGGIEVRSNFAGPPPDVGRDFGRVEGSVPFGRGETGMSLGRTEDPRDNRRLAGDQPSWTERDAARPETRRGQGWSSGGRSFTGRDVDNDPKSEFQRRDLDGRIAAPDRWLESRVVGPDRGPRDIMSNDRPLPRPGAVDPQIDLDRYGPSRLPAFSEGHGSRFGPDSSSGMTGMPDSRPRGDLRPGFARPESGFREPPRPLMEEPLRRPPGPDQHWAEDRRGFGPPGFDGRPPSPARDRHFPGGGFPARDEPWRDERHDVDPRQTRDGGFRHDLCVCAVNFPRSFNYREVRRFFVDSEIPRDGVKLINDRMGMRTGVAFIRVADPRSLDGALSKHGKMIENCRISIERCTDEDFDGAVDGIPLKRTERSRSPRNRYADVNPNLAFFVMKKLPLKTEKDDIRKFLGKFRIAADGGPFFELAYDKTSTGNALVAVEDKDHSKVLGLHRSLLNGSRVDVIKIDSYEFQERSRRARQCEAGDKSAVQNKSSASSFAGDKKMEKPEPKSKDLERSPGSAMEDSGRRQTGSNGDQRSYCVELRGIPYTAAPVMIQDFFRDINVPAESVHIVYNREHRATGIAYVEFGSIADQKRALEKNKSRMGHRFVEIRALGRTAMVEEYNRHQLKFGGTPIPLAAARSAGDRPKQGLEALLSMQNLHFDTQLEDILEFFAGYHPIVESIKLQYKDSKPTGDGLVAFQTVQEAESALRNKNRHVLLGKPVTLAWPKN